MIINLVAFPDHICENQIVAIGKQATGDLKLKHARPFQDVDLTD